MKLDGVKLFVFSFLFVYFCEAHAIPTYGDSEMDICMGCRWNYLLCDQRHIFVSLTIAMLRCHPDLSVSNEIRNSKKVKWFTCDKDDFKESVKWAEQKRFNLN